MNSDMSSTSQDLPRNGNGKLPPWAAYVLGLLGTIVMGAIGYGELRASHGALVERVARAEETAKEREQEARAREREVRALISAGESRMAAMDRNIVRICSKLKAGCEE
jgi:hypothetical protein